MDQQETQELAQDIQEEVAPQPESPFADSPYEAAPAPQEQEPIWQWEPVTEPAPKPKKPVNTKFWKRVLACVLVAALVASGCGITAFCINQRWEKESSQTEAYINHLSQQIAALKNKINNSLGNGNSISGTPNTSADGLTPAQVYAKCVNSVVAISASTTSQSSAGSGFILSEDGYVVTNSHVISGATQIFVTTHDGEDYAAELIGHDENNDVALLKIEAENLPYVTIGSSEDLIVGDQVVAIGNPLGTLNATLTVGYISGKNRTVSTDGSSINMLQTDAAINPGNSGGPLFNMKGEVIGITTAKYSGTTSSGASIEGIGFAIPIDDVMPLLEEIQNNGYVSTPYMGISITDQFAGMGAYVVQVDKGSAAAVAGIRVGDLIVSMGEHSVSSVSTLSAAMRDFKPGDTTKITVFRSGKLIELTITFGEKPHN